MYFEIDNTPENVSKRNPSKATLTEEICILKLAPFCSTPIVSFENVPLNVQSLRHLHLFNPKSESVKVFVKKRPDELEFQLSWYEKCIAANEIAPLTLSWCPQKSVSQRFTLQFCDGSKGKYDAIIVCKSIIKKGQQQKVNKNVTKKIGVIQSPIKLKSKSKSPKNKSNRLLGAIKKTTQVDLKTFNRGFKNDVFVTNMSLSTTVTIENKSQTTNISENFDNSNFRRETYLIPNGQKFLADDFEKENCSLNIQQSPKIKKKKYANYEQNPDISILSAIENMTFTPLKVYDNKLKRSEISKKNLFERVDHKYNYYANENGHYTDVDFENSKIDDLPSFTFFSPNLNLPDRHKPEQYEKLDFENDDCKLIYQRNSPSTPKTVNSTHSIIDLDYSGVSRIELSEYQNVYCQKPAILITDSLNYITNFENSSIGDMKAVMQTPHNRSEDSIPLFNPKRCSTEIKNFKSLFSSNDIYESFVCDSSLNSSNRRLSSETYIKGDSPIIPLNPDSNDHKHSSPYSMDQSLGEYFGDSMQNNNQCSRTLFSDNIKNYNERLVLRNSIRDKNDTSSAKSIIEANLWTKSPSPTCTPLASIPEEPSMTTLSEIGSFNSSKRIPFETFILDRTYETNNHKINSKPARAKWNKSAVNREPIIHKVDHTFKLPKVVSETHMQSKRGNIRVIEKSSHTLDVYTIATTVDPFLATTCLYDEEAFDRLESEFKKWLNYLVTPPSDLDTKLDIDIGKAWMENRNKVIPTAPTKEQVSSKYHTSHRLESLRKTAKTLIKNPHITQVFLKVTSQIERKLLSIRVDKNLHLDIGLQKMIIRLLLCYNPLWLRIGLEALYDKTIPLTSNDDVCGLSDFIVDHMFRDPYVSSKHILIQPAYAENIKKFTLKKFLFLVYFLDQAKQQKLIFHDPCLFCRNAPYKESRQILIQFTKELLSGVGDITKHLRPTGYVVSHKQSYLNEFKYGVHNLAVDLKDGIRLTRLMEIILMKENLISGLRTPAISRLQKIHNVQIALTALELCDFKIVGDITARDIADGHREKTLSLLWQLIHKFRAPLFENAAIVMQKWWRRKYFKISLENKIKNKKMQNLCNAAITIQSWWKGIYSRKQVVIKRSIETRACLIIQKNWRMWKCKSRFSEMKVSATLIQKFYRNHVIVRNAKIQLVYMRKVHAVTAIQLWYRKIKLQRLFLSQNSDRKHFLQLKSSVIKIQNLYRANLLMKRERKIYITLKIHTIKIQRFYRTLVKTRILRNQFLLLKSATSLVQNRFRANTNMRICRDAYEIKRNAIITLQMYYRNYLLTKKCRKDFLKIRATAIYLQEHFRNKLSTKILQTNYLKQKRSAVIIQQHYRAYCQMKTTKEDYLSKRIAIITIQRHYRTYCQMRNDRKDYLSKRIAAIAIQRQFRLCCMMRNARKSFLSKRIAVIKIQQYYRIYCQMKTARIDYLSKKVAAVTIQQYYRTYCQMKTTRIDYLSKRTAAVVIQRQFRLCSIMKTAKNDFLSKRIAAVTIQQYYRTYCQMKTTRIDYLSKRTAAVVIQRQFRLCSKMKIARDDFLSKRIAAVTIQQYYRSYCQMKTTRIDYLSKRTAAVVIQRQFRLCSKMKIARDDFLSKRIAAVTIQQYYRSYCQMKTTRIDYLSKRTAAVVIQQQFRLCSIMKTARNDFLSKKIAAFTIQQYYRTYCQMKTTRTDYLSKRTAAIVIQRQFRLCSKMKIARDDFLSKRIAAVTIQQYYRSYCQMKTTRIDYLSKRTAAIVIQRQFRLCNKMKIARDDFLSKRIAVVTIQQYYRSYCQMKTTRIDFLSKRTAAVVIQQQFRSCSIMKTARNDFLSKKIAAVTIQQYYRSYCQMKTTRIDYLSKRTAAIVIQRRFRSNLMMKSDRMKFLILKEAAITIQKYLRIKINIKQKKLNAAIKIQKYFRSYLLTKCTRKDFIMQRNLIVFIQRRFRSLRDAKQRKLVAITKIQQWYRSIVCMRHFRFRYLLLKKTTLELQLRYRNKILLKNQKQNLNTLRSACICIQRRYRAKRKMQLCRQRFLQIKEATVTLQQKYRAYTTMKLQREKFLQLKRSVVVIQTIYRSNALCKNARLEFLTLKYATIFIQQKYRANKLVQTGEKWMSILETRKIQNSYKSLRDSTIKLQAAARGFLARRKYKQLRTLKHRTIAAVQIQAVWRGYILRKKHSDDSRIRELRRRWREGALESTQPTLAERNDDALDVLGHFKDIASVIRAFKTLDFGTSVCPMKYVNKAEFIARRLILYMGATNRSVSTLETLQPALYILINLTRYTPTAHSVYNTEYLNSILNLLMRWCDKDNILSRSLCTLIWLFGQYEDIYEDLATFLQKKESYKILCKVRCAIIRKKGMDGRKRNTLNSNHSIRNSQTPIKFNMSLKSIGLPMTEPDYGISRSTKLKIFEDDVFAIDSIFLKFNLT